MLYNSNVTLTPISRDLAQGESASFQSFTNPDLDYKIIQKNTLRAGPMFRGYFTLNESNFQDFNLSSYQPGMFVERDFRLGSHESIGRFEYLYSTDFFDGDRIGNRHSATVSLTSIRPDLDAIYTYFTLASSDFTDDGEIPSQSSLDGVTITAGSTRFFQTGWKSLPNHSLGLDFESADTEGDDFRYHSLNLHGSTNWLFFEGWKFSPTWGIGFRDYPDFMGLIDRQEFFWRLHGRVQYTLNEMWAISAVAGHDRFASDNQDFDTERTEGGLVLTFTR